MAIVKSDASKPQQKRSQQGIPDDLAKYQGRPIHLTATAVVNANAGAGVNNQALRNPTGGPMKINQMKFSYNLVEAGLTGLASTGGLLGVQIDVNGKKITSGYIPIWLFGNTTNLVNEQTHGVIGATTVNDYAEYCFNLPRPLYIGPDDQVNCEFQHFGQVKTAVNARFSMSGQVVTKTETSRYLPYAACYMGKVFQTPFTVNDSDNSSETDLCNSTDDVVYIQRLTGRIDEFFAGTSMHHEGLNVVNAGLTLGIGGTDDFGCNLLRVTMFTGHGEPIVPYPTIFRNVFCGVTRAWELDGVPLKPGDYYLVNLASTVSGPNYTPTSTQCQCQPMVGMIGWRKVSV
jgi:hypothetical protein